MKHRLALLTNTGLVLAFIVSATFLAVALLTGDFLSVQANALLLVGLGLWMHKRWSGTVSG